MCVYVVACIHVCVCVLYTPCLSNVFFEVNDLRSLSRLDACILTTIHIIQYQQLDSPFFSPLKMLVFKRFFKWIDNTSTSTAATATNNNIVVVVDGSTTVLRLGMTATKQKKSRELTMEFIMHVVGAQGTGLG